MTFSTALNETLAGVATAPEDVGQYDPVTQTAQLLLQGDVVFGGDKNSVLENGRLI